MLNRTAIMQAAWGLYRRSAYARGPFDRAAFGRAAFGRALSMAWSRAKSDAALEAERIRLAAIPSVRLPRPRPTEMERLIEATAYLPAHMSQTRTIETIRARYA